MRHLNPTLKTWFENQTLNPAPPAFTPPYNPVHMLLLSAMACNGVTETTEDNKGPLIELFQDTIGKPQGEPWCMAFLQSCVAYVESFGFKSDLFPHEHCLTVWVNSKAIRPLDPKPGDIVVYQIGDSSKGHAEIITSINQKYFKTIGGNTSGERDSMKLDVDGVFTKARFKGGSKTFRELGFLRPFDFA